MKSLWVGRSLEQSVWDCFSVSIVQGRQRGGRPFVTGRLQLFHMPGQWRESGAALLHLQTAWAH